MKAIAIVLVLCAGLTAVAQSKPEEDAIRGILDNEITTWNQGDADGYSRHFAADGTFTNVRGMFFTGRQAYRDRHEIIFKDRSLGLSFNSKSCPCDFWHRTLRSARH